MVHTLVHAPPPLINLISTAPVMLIVQMAAHLTACVSKTREIVIVMEKGMCVTTAPPLATPSNLMPMEIK
jgi:hypothetical protein